MTGIQPITEAHLPAVLALNNAHATELSLLDMPRLRVLHRRALAASRIGDVDAFLIAFDQDSGHDGVNFRWFHDRYDSFVYMDRIAVAASARGRGLARRLYAELFRLAAGLERGFVAAEVNLDPPNPQSDALHASLDFTEVGRAAMPEGSRTVRYFVRRTVMP